MARGSFYTRTMLHEYGRQLLTTRRLARYHHLLHADAEHELSPEQKRKILVERVASELFDNLLFTGNENMVIEEIRQELEKEMGEKLSFFYPPGDMEISITRHNEEKALVPLGYDERIDVLDRIWRIIVARVDATML